MKQQSVEDLEKYLTFLVLNVRKFGSIYVLTQMYEIGNMILDGKEKYPRWEDLANFAVEIKKGVTSREQLTDVCYGIICSPIVDTVCERMLGNKSYAKKVKINLAACYDTLKSPEKSGTKSIKKLLATVALAGAMSTMVVMPAMAEWIEQPPVGWEDQSNHAGSTWMVEEENRQLDRLVATHSDNIKNTTPENSVERFNAVIKAVADYSQGVDLIGPSGNALPLVEAYRSLDRYQGYQFRDGLFSSYTMSRMAYALGLNVGLNMEPVAGRVGGTPVTSYACNINGTRYYADAWMYKATNDAQWLVSTNQPSFFKTEEQFAEEEEKRTANNPYLQSGYSFEVDHGQTAYCTD